MKLHYNLTSKTAKKILIIFLIIEVILCAIYFADFALNEPIWKLHELFDLDNEANIPTWFSTMLLFLTGAVALLTAFEQNYSAPPSKKGLIIFGLGFIFLSLDEAAVIHEKITWDFHNNPFVPYFDGTHGVWVFVYGCIGILMIIILFKDLWAIIKHYRKEALIFMGGMLVYLIGAGGAETITYFYLDKSDPNVYAAEVITEEFLEMAGATVLFYSVLLTAIKKTSTLPE